MCFIVPAHCPAERTTAKGRHVHDARPLLIVFVALATGFEPQFNGPVAIEYGTQHAHRKKMGTSLDSRRETEFL